MLFEKSAAADYLIEVRLDLPSNAATQTLIKAAFVINKMMNQITLDMPAFVVLGIAEKGACIKLQHRALASFVNFCYLIHCPRLLYNVGIGVLLPQLNRALENHFLDRLNHRKADDVWLAMERVQLALMWSVFETQQELFNAQRIV